MEHIIFDLNGVLFSINKIQALSKIGFMDVLAYKLVGKSIKHLETKMYTILDRIKKQTEPKQDLVPTHNGKPLPQIMCDWLRGTISTHDVIDRTLPFIDELDKQKFFSSKQEKRLIKKIIQILFDSQTRCNLYRPIKKGVKILKKCKKMGYKVYLLTNMDTELISLLEQKHPAIFALFDGKVVSADVHAIKPYKKIFNLFLRKHHVKPHSCCFIDDQIENVIAAKKIGMQGAHFNKKINKQLISLGILPGKKTPSIA